MALKSKGVWFGCGIPTIVIGLIVICVGLYFAGGFVMANSINNGHAEGNCESSIKFAGSLEKLYPSAITPFKQALINAHECDAYTQAVSLEAAGEFEQSYQAYQRYEKEYRVGKFTSLASEGAARCLAELGQQQLTEKQPESAVQTLEKLLLEYPDSNAALVANQVLPDAYLAWSETAWQGKDYMNATTRLEYLTDNYPQSNAAIEAKTKLPQVYVEWGETLWADKKYQNAIAKVEHVIDTYRTGTYREKASEILPKIYLEWGQELHGQENYAEAVEKFNLAAKLSSGSDSSTSDTSAHVREGLCSAHKDWSVSLLKQKNFESAVSHYQSAISYADNPSEKAEIADSIASVYLEWAQNLRSKQQYNDAFEKIGLAEKSSDSTVIADQVQQSQTDTIKAFSNSNGTEAKKEMDTAVTLTCQRKTVTLPIFALNSEMKMFYSKTALSTELKATTPGAFHYAVCVTSSNRKIQTCPYRNSVTGIRYYVERYVVDWQIKVLDVLTGKLLSQTKFTGAYPKLCPYRESSSGWVNYKKQYYGARPETKLLYDWLLKLKLH